GRPGAEDGRGAERGPGGDRAARAAAGLQADGLPQVPLPRAEKSARSQAQAEADPGQGDQVPAWHRRRRLRGEAAQADHVSRGRRQDQGYVALSRPRDGARGVRAADPGARESRSRAVWRGGAVSEARGPANGDGPRAEEESAGGDEAEEGNGKAGAAETGRKTGGRLAAVTTSDCPGSGSARVAGHPASCEKRRSF